MNTDNLRSSFTRAEILREKKRVRCRSKNRFFREALAIARLDARRNRKSKIQNRK